MTYEQYWYEDATMVVAYRKAYKLKQQVKEYEIWKQGMYVWDSLCKVSPILHAFAQKGAKPLPYPDKPYGIEQYGEQEKNEEQKEKEAENERLKAQIHFKQLFNILNKRFKKEATEEDGERR